MISYGKQTINQTDIDAVIEVLKSDWLTQGSAVDIFEESLRKYFGSKFACVVSNGTAALHLTSLVLGWKEGDIILTSPLTFVATSNSIIYANANPDFVDIDPTSFTIDPNKLEDKVKLYRKKGKSIKAVIGIDFAGHPCDWRSLRDIANKYELQLVNDNCHGMGSSYLGNKHYAVKYADVVTQSYHPVKHITTGEGGAILTNSPKLDEKFRLLRTHGITKDENIMEKNDGPWYYEMMDLGYNYRITDFQCALGTSQLKRLDSFIDKRRSIAEKYDSYFSKLENTVFPKVKKESKHSYHLYPLQIKFEKLKINKIEFFKQMRNKNINLQVHYIPIHLQNFYMKKYGFEKGDFPIAEEFYKNEVSFPIYPDLKQRDVQKIVVNAKKIICG